MNAYKCDRCDGFYTSKDFENKKDRSPIELWIERDSTDTIKKYDLCPKCCDELKKFIDLSKGVIDPDED